MINARTLLFILAFSAVVTVAFVLMTRQCVGQRPEPCGCGMPTQFEIKMAPQKSVTISQDGATEVGIISPVGGPLRDRISERMVERLEASTKAMEGVLVKRAEAAAAERRARRKQAAAEMEQRAEQRRLDRKEHDRRQTLAEKLIGRFEKAVVAVRSLFWQIGLTVAAGVIVGSIVLRLLSSVYLWATGLFGNGINQLLGITK